SATWRCKECHGWDYLGDVGQYGPGSPHHTGFGGVLGSTLTENELLQLLTEPPSNGGGPGVLNGHDYGATGLSTQDLADVIAFVLGGAGAIDDGPFVDPVTGVFSGDAAQGEVNYTTTGSCVLCHGADGTAINFSGDCLNPEYVGTVASLNPWEMLHKVRFGQPGTPMPSWAATGTTQGAADIGLYAQVNFPVACNPNETQCDQCTDGDVCNGAEVCVAGVCQAGVPVDCSDGVACTVDSCDPSGGCTHVPDDAACDDGDACTVDVCGVSGCESTPVPDGTSCTAVPPAGACEASTCQAGACVTVPLPAGTPCAGNGTGPCSGPDTCDGGGFCDDNDVPDGPDPACNDGDACNGEELCVAGVCEVGTPLDCDDLVPCTVDTCDAVVGCVNTPDDSACSDGDVCTGVEVCDAFNGCMPGVPLDCDDGDACNGVETCDPVNGCMPGVPLDCDDGNACTLDTCDPFVGCTHVPVLDGTACTVSPPPGACSSATCQAGVCVEGPLPAGTPCVGNGAGPCSGADTCDGFGVCDDNDLPDGPDPSCDDGDACTVETCVSGVCTPVDAEPGPSCARRMFMTPYECPNGRVCDPGDAGACGGVPSSCQVVPPSASTPGTSIRVQADGGDSVAYDVWVEETAPVALKSWQVWMYCSYAGGIGEATFVSNAVDDSRSDYVFPFPPEPFVPHLTPTENQGQCPTTVTNLEPRTSNVALSDFPVVTGARYLSTWVFAVSLDADGVFTLRPKCLPTDGCTTDLTKLLDPSNVLMPMRVDPLEIEVTVGQCCDANGCVGDMTAAACAALGNTGFNPDASCAAGDPCGCVVDSECQAGGTFDDGDPCTVDVCDAADPAADPATGCVHTCVPVLYGDVFADAIVEAEDVLCVLAANAGTPNPACLDADIWPCPPNQDGLNEAGDVIAVLGAAEGNPPCPDTCVCP
ncbi:MAG: c-type cytochrome, partial [Phycisphaerae bacterium]